MNGYKRQFYANSADRWVVVLTVPLICIYFNCQSCLRHSLIAMIIIYYSTILRLKHTEYNIKMYSDFLLNLLMFTDCQGAERERDMFLLKLYRSVSRQRFDPSLHFKSLPKILFRFIANIHMNNKANICMLIQHDCSLFACSTFTVKCAFRIEFQLVLKHSIRS